MQTPHPRCPHCAAPHWLSPRSARRVRAICPRLVQRPPEAEAESRRYYGAFCGRGCVRAQRRSTAVSAPGFHRRWPCLWLCSGPGPKSEGEPSTDAPDASERPAWPCLTDACSLGSWSWWWWCRRVCWAAEFVAPNQPPRVGTAGSGGCVGLWPVQL